MVDCLLCSCSQAPPLVQPPPSSLRSDIDDGDRMQIQTAPQQTTRQRRRIHVRAASFTAAAVAASALIVFLAATSSERRNIHGGSGSGGGTPAHQRAFFPSGDNTIGGAGEERTRRITQRRHMRRLDDIMEEDVDADMDMDMDQHHHHHDDGGGEYTEEPFLEDAEAGAEKAGQKSHPDPEPEPELELSTVVESINEEDQIFRVQEFAERLRPRPMLNFDANATKQFAHLHHMKTGGTSINHLLNCALSRARKLYQETQTQPDADADGAHGGGRRTGQALPFYSLEECSHSRYLSCINDNSTSAQSCRSSIASASVMQYCAPLHQMSRFDWLDADIVSVIRHPVDRVWSMFRFQTKSCFQCTPLLDIYRHIEEGTLDEFCGEKGCSGVCIPQLLNHETRNLLTDAWDEDDNGGESLSTEEEKLTEALFNLNNRVTLVGVTDELPVFAEMLGKVFPWLAEAVTAEGLGLAIEGDGASRRKLRKTTATVSTEPKACPLPHANASPKNNRCAPGNKHWDLPDEPDEETREAILRHNQLDLKVYEAAKARNQLQKQALGLR